MADPDKTEDASPHKLEEARKKGDIAKSKEFVHFFIFLGSALSFYFASRSLLGTTVGLFRKFFNFGSIKLDSLQDYLTLGQSIMVDILWILTPLCLAVFIFGIGAHLSKFGKKNEHGQAE